MNRLLNRTKKTLLGITALTILAFSTGLLSFSKATVETISLSGHNITANSATTSAVLGNINTPFSIIFKTGVDLKTDGNIIKIVLNGISIANNQSLTVSDLSLSGCGSSNLLEAAPGSNNNGAHEVTIINGSSENSNPEIHINLDTSDNTLNCKGGETYQLSIDSSIPQLIASSDVGNYPITVNTTRESGKKIFFVGNENQVKFTGSANSSL